MDGSILFVVVSMLVLIAILVWVFFRPVDSVGDGVVIVRSPLSCETPTGPIATEIVKSSNDPDGLAYTYTMWVLVKDFKTNIGMERNIFRGGKDISMSMPMGTNHIQIKIGTTPPTPSSKIPIEYDLPAITDVPENEWIHIAVVVVQRDVRVYVNGILQQITTIPSSIPYQNEKQSITVSDGVGWKGVLGSLIYYPRDLSAAEIVNLVQSPPTDSLQVLPGFPQSLSINWYNRGRSS